MIANFPFSGGDGPRSTSKGVYISQRIRFARMSGHVTYLNEPNRILTAKPLPAFDIMNFKILSKFYRRHYHVLSKFKVRLKPLLQKGQSELEFMVTCYLN